MTHVAVVGATGQIGSLVTPALVQAGHTVVAVTRSDHGDHRALAGTRRRVADVTDRRSLGAALEDAQTVLVTLGMPYRKSVWKQTWIPAVENLLAAVGDRRLVLLDNAYVYGPVVGPMTEQTPREPSSDKGRVRAAAEHLLTEALEGGTELVVARASDFFGPGAGSTIVGTRYFDGVLEREGPVRRATWLGDPHTLHTYAFTSDIARALVDLVEAQDTRGTWHLPSLDPIRGTELCRLLGEQLGAAVRPRPVSRTMLRLAALVDADAREQLEMQYQVERDYLLDWSKFAARFPGFAPTSWPQAMAQTVHYFRTHVPTEPRRS